MDWVHAAMVLTRGGVPCSLDFEALLAGKLDPPYKPKVLQYTLTPRCLSVSGWLTGV